MASIKFSMMKSVSLGILFIIFLTVFYTARAHDHWIGEHRYKSKFGFQCCGMKDCDQLGQGEVEPRKDGIWLERFKELIPYIEATPSEDEFSYRCHMANGQRSCFFFKYGSS